MAHPAIHAGGTAVVTGGASGIGLAAAREFASRGMKIVVADIAPDGFAEAEHALAEAGAPQVLCRAVDVSDRAALTDLEREVIEHFGRVDVLMNNAGIGPDSTALGPLRAWESILAVNLWGVVHGCQVFVPGMMRGKHPGLVINTGSKQGITAPPGNPAYNVSKGGVKLYTEALEHELRSTEGCQVRAHLLIPGFVHTGLTGGGRAEKPAGAWTPGQTAAFMMERLEAGDFYILCPDNEVDRPTDEKRMAWAMGDVIENRPPLSRWHPDFAQAFKDFLSNG